MCSPFSLLAAVAAGCKKLDPEAELTLLSLVRLSYSYHCRPGVRQVHTGNRRSCRLKRSPYHHRTALGSGCATNDLPDPVGLTNI